MASDPEAVTKRLLGAAHEQSSDLFERVLNELTTDPTATVTTFVYLVGLLDHVGELAAGGAEWRAHVADPNKRLGDDL